MIVTVEVTAYDIIDGAPESECSCAIALALRRLLPGRHVEVWCDGIIVDGDEIKLPEAARAFIDVFDEYRKPDPITFAIELPEVAL